MVAAAAAAAGGVVGRVTRAARALQEGGRVGQDTPRLVSLGVPTGSGWGQVGCWGIQLVMYSGRGCGMQSCTNVSEPGLLYDR